MHRNWKTMESNLLYCKQHTRGTGGGLKRSESANDAITNYIDACCCCRNRISKVFGLTHINLTRRKASEITCHKPKLDFFSIVAMKQREPVSVNRLQSMFGENFN